MLISLLEKTSVPFSEVERMVGKLVSLECAVPAGMWYTRNQYAAIQLSGLKPDAKKRLKSLTMIYVAPKLREEWQRWAYFLQQNKGVPWKN